MAVVFVIAEGPVTRIESITFPGAKAFSTLELKNVVTTSESGLFDFLKTAAFFDAERLKLDRDLLQRHYLKNGFPDAHVKEAQVTKNDAGTAYRISFPVEEGLRYQMQLGRIEATAPKVDTAGLEPLRQLKDGTTFSAETVEKSAEKMTLALSGQGHVFVRVKPVPCVTRPRVRSVSVL